jgi:hypothetical protein
MNGSFQSMLLIVCSLAIGCMPSSTSTTTNQSTTPGASAEEATPRETIGKTTTNVLDLQQAIKDGAVLAGTDTESSNPLLASAGAYRTTVAKIGSIAVQQKMQHRQASNIKQLKPMDLDAFMAEIIVPGGANGIRLPMLPYYQEYAWDEANQTLVTVDFPARKAEREKQR